MSRKGSLLTLFRNSAAVAVAAVAEGGTASSSASVVHGLFGLSVPSSGYMPVTMRQGLGPGGGWWRRCLSSSSFFASRYWTLYPAES
eukprot:jgi/Picre1/35067/NNA_002532.t1